MKKYTKTEIIFGAHGFLGSNLRQHLEQSGKAVISLPVDMLMNTVALHKQFLQYQPYKLYYLATYGNLNGQNNIWEMYQAAIIKLLNVLEATENTDCQAILTAGTTSEYGNKTEPMTEDMLLDPETFYGAAKAAATHLAQVWAKRNNASIIVFRPASITGVGEQSIHLIPTLIRSCVLGKPMPFAPDYVHDYIDVRDVCSALEILTDNANKHKGEIFNIGSGIQYANLAVKEMIEQITGKTASIDEAIKLYSQNVSAVWIADSTKMRSLGWKPKYPLRQTLKDMVKTI